MTYSVPGSHYGFFLGGGGALRKELIPMYHSPLSTTAPSKTSTSNCASSAACINRSEALLFVFPMLGPFFLVVSACIVLVGP